MLNLVILWGEALLGRSLGSPLRVPFDPACPWLLEQQSYRKKESARPLLKTFLGTITLVGRESLTPKRVEDEICVKVIQWRRVSSGHG